MKHGLCRTINKMRHDISLDPGDYLIVGTSAAVGHGRRAGGRSRVTLSRPPAAGRRGDPYRCATLSNVQPFLMRSWTVLVVTAACGLLLPAVPAQAAPEPCAAGYVRLTFDDGPNRTATPEILDTVAAHGVTATFFVVGQMAAANPTIVSRESREG